MAGPPSRVGGKDLERSSSERRDGPEGALVEREQPCAAIAIGEDDQGGIGQTDGEIAVPSDELASRGELGSRQAFDLERAGGQIVDEGELDVDAQPTKDAPLAVRRYFSVNGRDGRG